MAGIITMPEFPVLGIPTGMKQTGQRVDFKPDQFDLAIETKGYLLSWERAALCPCAPVVTQTEQPDPNCELCDGSGWLYFGAPTAQDLSDYELDSIQQAIVDENNGMVIRGIITGAQTQPDPYDVLTRRTPGLMNVTVRRENKLGYYDKITALDAEIVFSEIVEATGTEFLEARYKITGANYVRSQALIYKADVHFELYQGKIKWFPASKPAAGTRLAIHYLCHPTWLVVEHPHAARVTLNKFKNANPKSPTGDARFLPVQALVRYEFLPEVTA
jgi:hypothetical protein